MEPLTAGRVQYEAGHAAMESCGLCRVHQWHPGRVVEDNLLGLLVELAALIAIGRNSGGDKHFVQLLALVKGDILRGFDGGGLIKQHMQKIIGVAIVTGPA